MFENIGGIRIKDPGYKAVTISPLPDKRLGFADVGIETRNGKIRSFWEYREDMIRYEVEIPENVTAEITLSDGKKFTVSKGRHIFFTNQLRK